MNTSSTHNHTYPDGSNAKEHVIQSKKALVTIDQNGAYVTSWKVQHGDKLVDILYRGSTKKRSGIPLLFPYFGKAKHTRQHGFARDSHWKITSSTEHRIILELSSERIAEDAKKEYPYPFHAALTIAVDEHGKLLYTLEVKNTGKDYMPVSPGIHPYWEIMNSEKKHITVEGIEEFDASAIDWETSPPDKAYPFEKRAIVNFPSRKIHIKDVSHEGLSIKYLVVWSQPISKPDYNFVCFEPVCGDNYAIDESPVMIAPGEKRVMALEFSVTF